MPKLVILKEMENLFFLNSYHLAAQNFFSYLVLKYLEAKPKGECIYLHKSDQNHVKSDDF